MLGRLFHRLLGVVVRAKLVDEPSALYRTMEKLGTERHLFEQGLAHAEAILRKIAHCPNVKKDADSESLEKQYAKKYFADLGKE